MERREYSETMTALDGDSDFRRQLKPSALLRYVEQVSADHARAYGMDRQFFTEHQCLSGGKNGGADHPASHAGGKIHPDHGL